VVATGLVVLGATMTLVVTWYRAPMDRLTGHFVHNAYDYEGLVFAAYLLFAFGLAVLTGQLLRRTIPAMLAALVPWVAVRIFVEFVLRPYFMAPLHLVYHCSKGCIGGGNGIVDVPPVTGHLGDLLVGIGPMNTYQPASRFWAFQSIEAGIYVALTLAVLGTAVWLIHRRGTRWSSPGFVTGWRWG
jgi:hypothetical protein